LIIRFDRTVRTHEKRLIKSTKYHVQESCGLSAFLVQIKTRSLLMLSHISLGVPRIVINIRATGHMGNLRKLKCGIEAEKKLAQCQLD
jgi:hypothetical protein